MWLIGNKLKTNYKHERRVGVQQNTYIDYFFYTHFDIASQAQN